MFSFLGFVMGGLEEWITENLKILTRKKNTLRECDRKKSLPFDAREPRSIPDTYFCH